MKGIFIGLGSNLGDKKRYLDLAIHYLSLGDDIEVVKVSSYYETSPQYYLEQDTFLNAVVQVKTSLSPHALLDCCLNIEQKLQRTRNVRYGPRTIDLDILLFDDIHLQDPTLTIPHPKIRERLFILKPLSEIAPDIAGQFFSSQGL